MSYSFTSNAQPACPCCCPPDGKKCFQSWTAAWSCLTNAWTLTPGAAACLPVGTSTAWTQTAKAPEGCQYQRYVPYTPKHCCSADGDCSELGDTDPPDLPFGGSPPPDCCGCTPACLIAVEPGCCGGSAPDTETFTILSAVASPKCGWDTASPFHVHKVDASGLVGRQFPVPWVNGCNWEETFDVTAWVRMLQCVGDGSGCAACTPTVDVTASCFMTIRWSPGAAPTFSFKMVTTDTTLDNQPPPGFDLATNGVSLDSPFVDCCTAFTATGPGPDGFEDPYSIFITSVAGVPC